MSAVAFVMPVTGTGMSLPLPPPLPSSPARLSPQHLTAPVVRSAHSWPPALSLGPMATETAFVIPVTCTG